jgi:Helix-turn-helix domain
MQRRRETCEEDIALIRAPNASDFELRHYTRCRSGWATYCTEHNLLISSGCRAEVLYVNRRALLAPGSVLCFEPGSTFQLVAIERAGGLTHVSIGSRPLARLLGNRGPHSDGVRLRVATHVERSLLEYLEAARGRSVDGAHSWPKLRESLEALLPLLLADDTAPLTSPGVSVAMHDPRTGMPRGNPCRAGAEVQRGWRYFKRRYGLPPLAYSLVVRIALSRLAVARGEPLAKVAADHGFHDQSHFNRHFKRRLGLTPGRYLRDATLIELWRQ